MQHRRPGSLFPGRRRLPHPDGAVTSPRDRPAGGIIERDSVVGPAQVLTSTRFVMRLEAPMLRHNYRRATPRESVRIDLILSPAQATAVQLLQGGIDSRRHAGGI